MAIMAIIFAAIVPQFRVIRNSWASKQASAEILQNGRVLIDHLNRNLSKAVRITSVSPSSETNGYIELEDNDAYDFRYDVNSTTKYVQFGLVGDLGDLAGPVSQLRFTCYDSNDLDTPITDVTAIRCVKVETKIANTGPGQDKTFTTWAYLRTNYQADDTGGGGWTILKAREPWFEFDNVQGMEPALCQIDQTHYLCVYNAPLEAGAAVVLMVNTGTWNVSKGLTFPYDTTRSVGPALAQIDPTHYLCSYSGLNDDGVAVVLMVNTGTWNVSKGSHFVYDDIVAPKPALAKIDPTHYLCAYEGAGQDGWAVVLTINTGNWTISKETPFEFDTTQGTTPALSKIDGTHYLCAYQDKWADGWATVLTVDTGTWAITNETPFEYDTQKGSEPALAQIDETHYLCTYLGNGDVGYVTVLTVDTGTWTITNQTPLEYDTVGMTPALLNVDNTHCLCAYMGPFSDGWSVVLTVDTGTWAVSKETAFEFDIADGASPALAKIDDSHYLCAYTSTVNRGWAGVLRSGPELLP